MKKDYVIGVDLGTGSTRAGIFKRDGTLVGKLQCLSRSAIPRRIFWNTRQRISVRVPVRHLGKRSSASI